MDEPIQDIHPRITRPQLFPYIRCAISDIAKRIASASDIACTSGPLIERQKSRVNAFEARRHKDAIGIDCEMDDCPVAERCVSSVSVLAILFLRVFDSLTRQRIFQLRRSRGNTVDQQAQIEGFVGSAFVR